DDACPAQRGDASARRIVVRGLSGPRGGECARAARTRLHGDPAPVAGPARDSPHHPAPERRRARRPTGLAKAGAVCRALLPGHATPFHPAGILTVLGNGFLNRAEIGTRLPCPASAKNDNHLLKSTSYHHVSNRHVDCTWMRATKREWEPLTRA